MGSGKAGQSLPRSPPQPGRARHLSPPAAFGLRAAVDDPRGDVGETSKSIRREATHIACSASEAAVMVHMGSEATNMAYSVFERPTW